MMRFRRQHDARHAFRRHFIFFRNIYFISRIGIDIYVVDTPMMLHTQDDYSSTPLMT